MTRFKTVIVAIAIIAFFGYCMWLSPNLFGNRIKSEMVADSLLKYDQGAGVYLASKDDNSKVFFGQSGKCRFYGTGALTLKASPKSGENYFGSGFNLLIEGGDLKIKAGQADILTGSVSPNGQFLALMSVDGILTIHEISTGKETYRSIDSFFIPSLVIDNPVEYPGFFWTDQGLIVQQSTESTDSFLQLFPWQQNAPVFGAKNESKYFEIMRTIHSIASIEPSTGNTNVIPSSPKELNLKLSYAVGRIDSNNILCAAIKDGKMVSSSLYSFDLATSSLFELPSTTILYLGFHGNKLFYIENNTLVYSKISAKSASDPIAVNLPELDGEKLTPELIENLRVTSKGYLHFRHIKTAKTYMLEPITGVYVEIHKERHPY